MAGERASGLAGIRAPARAVFYINDHLGTPQQLVDAQGTVVWQAAALPFGEAQLRVGTVTNNLRFPGQYFDAETGLHYNWNRYYAPETGRYLSPDPIGLDGGLNLYAYVENDPVNWIDPEGLFAEEHTKGKRPSTKGKHEKGQTRKKTDHGGEKGDKNRRHPRNPPGGWRKWKGPWPPGTYPLLIFPWQIECVENPHSPKCEPDYCGEDQA